MFTEEQEQTIRELTKVALSEACDFLLEDNDAVKEVFHELIHDDSEDYFEDLLDGGDEDRYDAACEIMREELENLKITISRKRKTKK